MEKNFSRIIIDVKFEANETFIELLQDFYDIYDLTYNFNNEYFINENSMCQEDKEHLIDKCKKESIKFKVIDDSFEIDKTDAIGMYTLSMNNSTGTVTNDKSLFIFKTDEIEELHFILTFYPITKSIYEVNIIDVKKKLFLNDHVELNKSKKLTSNVTDDKKKSLLCNSIEIDEDESLTAKIIVHYKNNQTNIHEQGFEKSAALKLLEYCFKRNMIFVIP